MVFRDNGVEALVVSPTVAEWSTVASAAGLPLEMADQLDSQEIPEEYKDMMRVKFTPTDGR